VKDYDQLLAEANEREQRDEIASIALHALLVTGYGEGNKQAIVNRAFDLAAVFMEERKKRNANVDGPDHA
jgi:hypothetical protein